MPHRFVIKDRGQVYSYSNLADIPLMFDHVVEFAPEIPLPPHNDAQHEQIHKWNDLLIELMRRERASSG